MAETVSVRIASSELKEINEISKLEKKTKSNVLREVLDKGIKEKRIEIALDRFRNKELSLGKASKIAQVPLSRFMDMLVEKNIDFHYGIKELEEDFEGFI